jgi:AraC family transcriptional activator of pobA
MERKNNMDHSSINALPFQPMLSANPIQVQRLNGFYHPESFEPHRHNFYMLYWSTEGVGEHRIDFLDYNIQPNRIFFLHLNQVHQMLTYPADGWMILFNQVLFQGFLNHNPSHEQTGLFDYFNRSPFVDVDDSVMRAMNILVEMLQNEVNNNYFSSVIQHYLSILLLYAGNQHIQSNYLKQSSMEADTMRKLKGLIGANFRSHRDTLSYSAQMGLPARKLNEIAMKTMGRLVPELITERLLCESEALLGATAKSIKEISYELGFADQAHFAFFFKKCSGVTPSDFRKKRQAVNKSAVLL